MNTSKSHDLMVANDARKLATLLPQLEREPGRFTNRFSFMVFGGSQVLIDIEPGVRILFGASILHGPSHTIAGAFLIGIVAALIGKPISEFTLRLLRIPHIGITWTASATGAFIGTFSHIFLDAIMHSDMSPWSPLAGSNELLGLV